MCECPDDTKTKPRQKHGGFQVPPESTKRREDETNTSQTPNPKPRLCKMSER